MESVPEINFNLNWSGSDLDLHIFDSEGRHIGMNYTTGKVDLQIAGSTYISDSNSEQIKIPNPTNKVYQVKIYGKQVNEGKEPFSITILKAQLEQPSLTTALNNRKINSSASDLAVNITHFSKRVP